MRRRVLIPLTFLWLCGPLGCAGGSAAGPNASLPRALNDGVTTRHEITLGGQALDYTATAGHLTATSADGKPLAAIFSVAYLAENQDPATRPVTFLYNGGPGSCSVWLHLGSFGPRRLVTGDPATTAPTPFALVENEECLLDATDLVFVDAVGTGLSEAVAPNVNQTFWGVDQDAKLFRDYIRTWLAANRRELSPVYIFGESYGTPRSAVLANLMLEAGVPLAGVVLQSSILNYNTNTGMSSQVSAAGFLPTYAAVGAWFKLTDPVPSALPPFLEQVRAFTRQDYVPAVQAWFQDGSAPSTALATRLQDDTGIGASQWQAELNLPPGDFQSDLLPGTIIGRYDGRVSAPVGSAMAGEGDPSSTFISASFAFRITGYLTDELGYAPGKDYSLQDVAIDYWDFSHDGLAEPDTIPDLAAAITRKPDLKVLSLNGWHDLATPFYQTELDLARLGRQPNLGIKHYQGGHMIYLDDVARPLEKADLVAFYRGTPGWSAPGARPVEPPAVSTAPAWAGLELRPYREPWPGHNRPMLVDPWVPPGKRHITPGTETSGEQLREQVRRKLVGSGFK
jgi:carboxypeptidase C (cathepsin A)